MRKLVVCSGAGLSAESGIATFRDSGGLWEQHKIEEVCNMSTFLENYIKVNDFYDARRRQLSKVTPNSAHEAIARIEHHFEVVNFTTNVDDLLERAGCTDVRHLHGTLTQVYHNHGTPNQRIVDVGYNPSEYDILANYPVKPAVVFFGEMAPMYQQFFDYCGDLSDDDVAIVVGSSEQVFPFTSQLRHVCQFKGKIVFINNDGRLCDMMHNYTNVYVFHSKATQFFEKLDPSIL